MKLQHLSVIVGKFMCLLTLALCGCQRASDKNPSTVTKGSPKATWEFWEALHKPYLNSNDVYLINTLSLEVADPASQQYAAKLIRQLATGQEARCKRLSSLPVLNVDRDLADHAVQFITSRREIAQALGELAEIAENPSGLPDAPEAGFAFFLSLLQHGNDGDDAFWNTLKEQAIQHAGTVSNARTRNLKLVDEFKVVGDRIGRLDTQEMSLRINLAQRYNREFPAGQTYGSATNSPATPASSPPPTMDRDRMMRDLLGRKIGREIGAWTFDAGEFRSFEILDGKVSGDLAQYEVKTHVQGSFSGRENDFKLRLTYRNQMDSWQLVFVVQSE